MNLNSTNCNWRLGDYTYVKRTYKKKPEKKKKTMENKHSRRPFRARRKLWGKLVTRQMKVRIVSLSIQIELFHDGEFLPQHL